jgi:hypothetical protein
LFQDCRAKQKNTTTILKKKRNTKKEKNRKKMDEESTPQPLNGTKALLWVFVAFFTVSFMVYFFYVPTATTFSYTYQYPPGSPGVLQSDRWGKDFWLMGLLNLLWLIPLSILFMMDDFKASWRRITHAIITIVLVLYIIAVIGTWLFDYSSANNNNGSNWNNPANDPRWCLVHYLQPGAQCFNTAPSIPAVAEADLIVSRLFLFRFWYLVAVLVVLLVYVVILLVSILPSFSPKTYEMLPTKSRMTFMKKKLLQ